MMRSWTMWSGAYRMPFMAGEEAVDLLEGETDGLAVDFTDTDHFDLDTWDMEIVQERAASVDTLQSPHVFFTQSGTSAKYVMISATTLGWSPHNICTQSEAQGTTWSAGTNTVTSNATTAPDGTATADLVEMGGANAQQNDLSNIAGVVYTISVYLKFEDNQWTCIQHRSAAGADRVRAWFDVQNGVVGTSGVAGSGVYISHSIASAGSGWYRCSVVGSISATDLAVGIFNVGSDGSTTNNTGDVYIWGAQLNRGNRATTYIATTTAAVIGLPISYGEGLLVEPARTNLCTASEGIVTNAAWANNQVAGTDGFTAPDGSSTAELIDEQTATNVHRTGCVSTSFTSGTAYTWSAFFKDIDRQWVQLHMGNTPFPDDTVYANFDIANGTIGTVGASCTAAIVSVGNGWYRCSITATADATVADRAFLGPTTGTAAARNASYTGTSLTFYAWGAQLEASTIATSYIPTTTATVTRAGDYVNALISSFSHSFPMTQYVSYICGTTGSSHTLVSLYDPVGGDEAGMYVDGSNNVRGYVETGATQADIDSLANLSANTLGQATTSYATNDISISVDGLAVQNDVSASLSGAITTLAIGSLATAQVRSFTRKYIYVKRQVSDADLPTWRYEP